MCEQSLIGARASVMVYDDGQKKWIPSGSSSGLSKVQIFHHQQNNTFRVVGRKLQDHEVVINCSIIKGLKYNQATATFHQWRDSKFVYGLNFSSQQDAEAFARAMMHALEILSGRVPPPMQTNPNQQNQMAYEEDMGYRTMTREDAAIMQQQQQLTNQVPSQQQQQQQQPPSQPPLVGGGPPGILSPQTPTAGSIPPGGGQSQVVGPGNGGGGIPVPPAMNQQQQQQQQTHHRTNSAPQPPVLPSQQQKPIYASQQSNSSTNSITYGSNSQPQYQQPIYVASNQNQMLNQMASQIPPMPPMMPNGGPAGAAIYATATCSPSTNSSGNPIYAGQQQMMLPPGVTPTSNQYGQTNGIPPAAPPYGGQPQYGIPPVPQMPMQQLQQMQQQPPQMQQVNAPPQAPPPPMPPAFPLSAPTSIPQPPAPPIPPASGGGGGGAPPPPPPPPGAGGLGGKGSDNGISSLALQLASAKLKRSTPAKTAPAAPVSTVTENSGSSTSSGGSGRSSSGMASMMDEMAKTLARRRAQAEKKEPDSIDDGQSQTRQRAWEKSSTLPHKLGGSSSQNSGGCNNTSLSGSESPKPSRKRYGSASEETILKQINGDSFSLPSSVELENFKDEILREMRSEIAKAKQEIIEAIKSEFNRR
ncbi:protein enabled isoform X2 [Uranotaenia lowii]|uniref:protein enabled isoform X2 n=1 Tax=Uranotaenia lowii TaxID=190385 RepID=UPI00247A7D33|nr:protein enabled isoform X2 [Uranotaenia lowii]